MTRTISLPPYANGVPGFILEVVAAAAVFHCITATASFSIRTDDGTLIPCVAGKGFGNPDAKRFTRIGFYNTETVAVEVTYYAGLEAWSDPNGANNNIVTSESAPVLIFDELNPFYALSLLTIPNNTSVDILTAYRIGDRVYPRRSVHFTNITSGRNLQIITLYGAIPDYNNNILTFAVEGRCIDIIEGATQREYDLRLKDLYLRAWNKSGATITCPIWAALSTVPLPGYY